MKKIPIQNLTPSLVSGIEVQMPGMAVTEKETYYEWYKSSLITRFKTTEISGGFLKTWHHVPVFSNVETHLDAEMFYFISGIALMPFLDIRDGEPLLDTAQIVRIHPGSQIIIPAGKGHYVAVAEGDDPLIIVVIAPEIEDIKMKLSEPIEGIS